MNLNVFFPVVVLLGACSESSDCEVGLYSTELNTCVLRQPVEAPPVDTAPSTTITSPPTATADTAITTGQ